MAPLNQLLLHCDHKMGKIVNFVWHKLLTNTIESFLWENYTSPVCYFYCTHTHMQARSSFETNSHRLCTSEPIAYYTQKQCIPHPENSGAYKSAWITRKVFTRDRVGSRER